MLRKTASVFCGFGLLLAAVIIASAQSSEHDKFVGKWKANLSKSQRHPNHLFESMTLQFEMSDGIVTVTYSGVNMSGKPEGGSSKLHPDGKEHPIAEAPDVLELTKWIGKQKLETIASKDGKVLGQSTYELSDDGATLTVKINSTDAKGRPFDQVIVFDRQ